MKLLMHEIEIYQEKNFLNHIDPEAYKAKQAGSCRYLIREMSQLNRSIGMGLFGIVFSHLSRVHMRQYLDIGIIVEEVPETSFYFDSMFDLVLMENEDPIKRIWIHAISYLRGVQRYEMLIKQFGADVEWKIFCRDAYLNACICIDFLEVYCTKEENACIRDFVVSCEEIVMKQIDELNAKKEIREAVTA